MRKIAMMKKTIAFLVLLLSIGFSQPSLAQAPDPNDFFDDDPNPGDAPIDVNLSLLLTGGLLYGLYVLKSNKTKKA
jgi:hypothetical protein